MNKSIITAVGLVATLAACAQQEESITVIPEPVFDKMGNLVVSPETAGSVTPLDSDGDGVPDTPGTPDTPDPEPVDDDPNQVRNQNQNENQNQNQNQNQSSGG